MTFAVKIMEAGGIGETLSEGTELESLAIRVHTDDKGAGCSIVPGYRGPGATIVSVKRTT